MMDKRLFPGVSEQDIQNQEIKKQKVAKEKEDRIVAINKAKQSEKGKRFLYDLYNPQVFTLKFKISVIAILNIFIGEFYRQCVDFSSYTRSEIVSFRHALAESYIPTYHYHPKIKIYDQESVSFYMPPNERWIYHTLVLLSEALVLALVAMNRAKTNKQIDLMLEIEKLSKEKNIDAKYIKQMAKVAPDIIENMSKDSRVYFDMLMDEKFDGDKTPELLNVMVAVVQGHIQTHPEDMKKLFAVFDKRSIPQQFKYMATTKER